LSQRKFIYASVCDPVCARARPTDRFEESCDAVAVRTDEGAMLARVALVRRTTTLRADR